MRVYDAEIWVGAKWLLTQTVCGAELQHWGQSGADTNYLLSFLCVPFVIWFCRRSNQDEGGRLEPRNVFSPEHTEGWRPNSPPLPQNLLIKWMCSCLEYCSIKATARQKETFRGFMCNWKSGCNSPNGLRRHRFQISKKREQTAAANHCNIICKDVKENSALEFRE